MKLPEIRPPGRQADFHDSSLLSLALVPEEMALRVVLSTPDSKGVERLWEIRFAGVLKIDLECLGDGQSAIGGQPPEVHDVVLLDDDQERDRWVLRLRETDAEDPDGIHYVLLASSYLRGWGERERLEGIGIICRDWSVAPAPKEFSGMEFSRPKISAGDS